MIPSAEYVKENTKVELNGIDYKVVVASTQCIVLKGANGDLVPFQNNQFVEQVTQGNLVVKKAEPGVVIEMLNDEQLLLADMYRKLFDLMGKSNKPYSIDNYNDYIKPYLIANYNFNPLIVPSFSTVAAKRREWIENGQLMAPIVTRKPHINKSSKFDQESIDLMDKCVEKYFLKIGHLSRAKTFAHYLVELEKSENRHLTKIKKSSFYSFITRLDDYQVAVAQKGLIWANKEFRTTYGNYMASHAAEKVEIDAVHFTINILDDSKENVIATKVILYLAIDIYTRLIVGYYCSLEEKKRKSLEGKKRKKVGENADAVIELLKRVVSPSVGSHSQMIYLGKPRVVVCDAGTAFNNEQVKNFFNHIDVTLIVTEAGKPWKKPFIERFNRTLREQFCSVLPQYTDNKTSHLTQKELKAAGAAISKSEFIFELESFLFEYYQNNPHMGLGNRTPREVYDEGKATNIAKLPLDRRVLENLRGNTDTRAYCKNKGISFGCGRYNSSELTNFMRSVGECKVKINFTLSDASVIGVMHPLLRTVVTVPNVDPRISAGTTVAEAKLIYKKPRSDNHVQIPFTPSYNNSMKALSQGKNTPPPAHILQEGNQVDQDHNNNSLPNNVKHHEQHVDENNTNNTASTELDGLPVGQNLS